MIYCVELASKCKWGKDLQIIENANKHYTTKMHLNMSMHI